MGFKVIDPGVMALLQDTGRFGYQHLGVTTGGPMDEYAFDWANWLLGNPRGAVSVEITYGHTVLDAEADMDIALTGADLGATLNGQYLSPWQSLTLRAGDRLTFNTPVNGLRAYLAVAGGFGAITRLGSAATVMREQLGGLDGTGQRLLKDAYIQPQAAVATRGRVMPEWAIPDYAEPVQLGLIAGYQYDRFAVSERMKLLTGDYTVTSNIDRMGYRLSGEPVLSGQSGIISEGIAFGAVQIPQDGQPIVLMRDRQTIGGYPKVGCVFSLDVARLAQRMPGSRVGFYLMDVAEAENRRLLFDRLFTRQG